MSKWNNDNIQNQYEKEAEMKYSHTPYYQAFKRESKTIEFYRKTTKNKRKQWRGYIHSLIK